MTDIQWTLLVFAGPSALSGPLRTEGLAELHPQTGLPLPLADALAYLLPDGGKLPAQVLVLAETVGAPTRLQQLTGEWPAQRLIGQPGQPIAPVQNTPAQRDLGRFLAWADEQTPKGSKQALIVLGDILQAIGAAPEAMPAGDWRPDYPSQIVINRKSYTHGTGDNFSDAAGTYPLSTLLNNMAASDVIYFQNSNGTTATGYASSYTRMASGSYKDPNNNLFTITDNGASGNPQVSLTPASTARSLDAIGPADVDLASRRIDALAVALNRRHIDLLASDGRELTQLSALRRLAPKATVMLGPQRSAPGGAEPLTALLTALASSPALEPEALAAQALERYGARVDALLRADDDGRAGASTAADDPSDLVAVRSSCALQLVEALDAFAGRALDAGKDSPYMRCATEALKEGGDLAHLTARLATIDVNQAHAIEANAAGMLLTRRGAPGEDASGSNLGIRLDGPGLQLGARSRWTNLLDSVDGRADLELMRRSFDDVQALETAGDDTDHGEGPGPLLHWIEYRPDPRIDVEETHRFRDFLARELDRKACRAARHVALIARGRRAATRPASLTFEAGQSLSIVALARCLREALDQRSRGPLAMLVLDDPELLGLEIAYELREVADVFITGIAGPTPPALDQLAGRLPEEVIRACEGDAEKGLTSPEGGSIAALVGQWRRDVARRLANHLVAPDHDADGAATDHGGAALQGIDMRHIEVLCRRFDRLCRWMLTELGNPAMLNAIHAAAPAPSLTQLINLVQQQLLASAEKPGLRARDAKRARDLNKALGEVYNWITGANDSISLGGSPFWIDLRFRQDRKPDGYSSRLRITAEPNQPRDYRSLSFHHDVCLQSLLSAGRLIDAGTQKLWGLLELGLEYAPESERRDQLARLLDEPGAADYFANLGTPPLLSLNIEQDTSTGYELRLSSSESAAVLVRQQSLSDFATVHRSLDGLEAVFASGVATREGWHYLEALGGCLAEDVVNDSRASLEREREAMLASGHGREAHLALALPRELMRFPWELMVLPPLAPGQRRELLAERFALGRQMWSDREVRRVRRVDERVRILVVADPRTGDNELPGARAEARAIQVLCAEMSEALGNGFGFECEASIGDTVTRTALRKLVRDGRYDVLHFAGHGKYDSKRPEQSGWRLSDDWLSATELRNTLMWSEAPPWLIYANACSAGMVDGQAGYDGEVHGMAEACIRAGVNAYLAPLRKIHDDSARWLATEFYRRLLLERTTIGVALRHARARVRKIWEIARGDTGLGDISWAGMVLFGNPTARLNESAD